jgi:hypothetical protein
MRLRISHYAADSRRPYLDWRELARLAVSPPTPESWRLVALH